MTLTVAFWKARLDHIFVFFSTLAVQQRLCLYGSTTGRKHTGCVLIVSMTSCCALFVTNVCLGKGGVVYRQKKGGGSAQFHHSARCASKWRRQISRSCAWRADGSATLQNLYFFSNVAPKILENAENAQKKRATRNRLVYRDDAEGDWASRCRHRETQIDRPKNFNRFKSRTQHLSNEDESGRLQPDLYEFSRWPCHVKGSSKRQRSLALPLHKKKKSEAKKVMEQSAFEPASCRFGRRHFEAHLALWWNRALPPPFFGGTQTPPSGDEYCCVAEKCSNDAYV